MFKKLLSNLPFNPSLVSQVAFYARRIHREAAVRRIGVGFMALALVVQVFAVISPPESSVQASSNDIISGGFQTRDQAVLHCLNSNIDFQKILKYYGVTCDILSKAETVTVRSTDYERRLDSLGRNPQGDYIYRPKTGKTNPTNEYDVRIDGVELLHMRNLWAWDSYSYSEYRMLRMKNIHGDTIMIMYNCGNIVTVGEYSPPVVSTPPPAPEPPEEPKDACPETPDFQRTTDECDVCPNVPGTQTNGTECYPCPEAETDDSDNACLDFNKTARNDTQSIADANETKAAASDIIEYTLTVNNTGNVVFKDFVFEEPLGDVLEYATVVDLDGGTLNETSKTVTWPAVDIAAKQSVNKTISIKVKNPIPQSPISSSYPGSFDLVMTNAFYDKSINIELPAAPHKEIEIVTKTLPNTGPGESLAVGFVVFSIMGYFFARSRLMATELDIVKEEFSAGI